ncbi:hypothetical protein RCO48_30330 [Peribacillus frigoritolerans]|nr:hypothetical protein [Peribacillus frigoritolerans]
MIDVVILVNSTLDIKEAHDIATHVEKSDDERSWSV